MTINEAFAHLTSKRSWYAKSAINRKQAYVYKSRGCSEKIKRKLLIDAGYKLTPEVWSIESL